MQETTAQCNIPLLTAVSSRDPNRVSVLHEICCLVDAQGTSLFILWLPFKCRFVLEEACASSQHPLCSTCITLIIHDEVIIRISSTCSNENRQLT